MMHIVLSLILAVVLALPARAAGPLDPMVEYSADSTIGTGTAVRIGRLWRAKQALRHETTEQGQTQIVIIRLDRQVVWLSLPALQLAIEVDVSGLGTLDSMLAGKGGLIALGIETVDGRRTTKYRVAADVPRTGRFNGHVWSTAEGVVLKIDGAGEHAGREGRVHILFRNIRIGPQDAALFEPPVAARRVKVTPEQIETMLKGIEQLQRLMGAAGR